MKRKNRGTPKPRGASTASTLRDIDRPRVRDDWPRGTMARYYLHCTLGSRIPRRPDMRDRHPRFAKPTDA